MIWRPALKRLFDGGAPLRACLTTREIATDAPQIRLLLGVVLELQLGNVQLQPRRDELADRGLCRAIELGSLCSRESTTGSLSGEDGRLEDSSAHCAAAASCR